MTKVSDTVLKQYFENGKVPNQTHYENLIDSKLSDPLVLTERSAPDTPGSGLAIAYLDTNGFLVVKNDTGLIMPAMTANIDLNPLTAIRSAGSATIGQPATGYQYCVMCPDGSNGVMDWVVSVPRGWAGRTIGLYITWSPSSTNQGNAYFAWQIRRIKQGMALVGSTPSYGGEEADQAPGVIDQVKAKGFYSITLSDTTEGEHMAIRVYRVGGHTSDTFTGVVQISGVKISISS